MRKMALIFTILAVCPPILVCLRRRSALRVVHGDSDTTGKYCFVVALVLASEVLRQCTGTLLSPEWVLTAAHCIAHDNYLATYIQYDNMTTLPNSTQTKNRIIERILHPGYRDLQYMNDIGLMRVHSVPIQIFGILSAVDYNSLLGHAVEYAGYGRTEHNDDKDDRRPVIIGKGVVTSCREESDDFSIGPYLCVAPKCSNKLEHPAAGDSGGPLFYDNKIIGVVSYVQISTNGDNTPVAGYTATSPFLTWIHDVMQLHNNSIPFNKLL